MSDVEPLAPVLLLSCNSLRCTSALLGAEDGQQLACSDRVKEQPTLRRSYVINIHCFWLLITFPLSLSLLHLPFRHMLSSCCALNICQSRLCCL